MEPVVLDPAVGHPRVVRRLDRAAEGAGVAETGVVNEHQQHIRRPGRRGRVADQVPVGLRSLQRPVDHSPGPLPADRQTAAVQITHRRSLKLSGPDSPMSPADFPWCCTGRMARSGFRAGSVTVRRVKAFRHTATAAAITYTPITNILWFLSGSTTRMNPTYSRLSAPAAATTAGTARRFRGMSLRTTRG